MTDTADIQARARRRARRMARMRTDRRFGRVLGRYVAAVRALRHNRAPEPFRGLEGAALLKWLPHVGHKHKLPSRLKTFRLQRDDLELLERLQRELGGSQTAIVRRGLRALASKTKRPASTETPAPRRRG